MYRDIGVSQHGRRRRSVDLDGILAWAENTFTHRNHRSDYPDRPGLPIFAGSCLVHYRAGSATESCGFDRLFAYGYEHLLLCVADPTGATAGDIRLGGWLPGPIQFREVFFEIGAGLRSLIIRARQ